MALGVLFLLEVIILFSFIVTGIFMFIPKNDVVNKIFFALAIMLGIFVTIIDATALPSNYTLQIVMAWMGLIPAAGGVIISVAAGKPTVLAKILVMLTSVLGALGYFFFM